MLEWFRNRRIGIWDALTVYGASLVILIYLGTFYQLNLGFWGLAVTQLTLLVVPIGLICLRGARVSEVLSLKLPGGRQVVGSIILWLGLFFVVNGVTQVLMPLSEMNQQVAQELAKLTYHPILWINLLVVAVIPAVCEEILFRGVIYKGISNKFTPMIGLVLSSILFGMLHFDWIRMVPTTILGLGIGYTVYKTGSIFLGMLMHAINNGLVVVMGHIVPMSELPTEELAEMPDMWQGAIAFIVLGIGITLLGMQFFKTKQKHL